MPARVCSVSFTDTSGITHSVEVAAESLYEAAILGAAAFRNSPLLDGAMPGAATRLTIEVRGPASRHEVTMGTVTRWLDSVGRGPKEQLVKARLREVMGGG